MELYMIISVLDRKKEDIFLSLTQSLDLHMTNTIPGIGTATSEHLEKYGLSETQKSIIITAATADKTQKLIKSAKRRLMIDVPGNGIIMTVPIKSVGGGKTLAYMTDNEKPDGSMPDMNFEYELIIVVLNQSYMYDVMEAAKSAGATGGTMMHAKGTGTTNAKKFLGVSLATEKEVIMITVKAAEKAAVMKAISEKAGAGTPAGALCFSLPVSAVAGLRDSSGL